MKRTFRIATVGILNIAGWASWLYAGLYCMDTFFFLYLTHSSTEDDATLIATRLIPHLKSPKNHETALDVAQMHLGSMQRIAQMLSLEQFALIRAFACLCAGILCWLLLRRLFPDRKELLKVDRIPGIPAAWQRPIKFW
jgi:hypothetical protein